MKYTLLEKEKDIFQEYMQNKNKKLIQSQEKLPSLQ